MTAVSINFNRSDVNFAATVAYQKAGQNKPLARAIDRALVMLAAGRFSYDGNQVIIHSTTSGETYRIAIAEPMQCTCKGRQKGYVCKHIVAARLLVRAAEHHAEQDARELLAAQTFGVRYKGFYYSPADLQRSAAARAQRQAEVDALFA